MTSRVQSMRSSVAGSRPAASTREVGELFVNFADLQLGVIDAGKLPQDLLAVRVFSATSKYAANDIVVYNDHLYQANAAVGPKIFTATDWTAIAGANSVNNSVTTGSVTITPMTPGSVLFAGTSGTLSQDNPNLYYDDVNNRLSIGSTVPTRNLDVTGTFGVTGNSVVGGTLDVAGTLGVSGQLNVTGQAGFASLARFTSTDAVAIPVGTDLQRPTGAALLQGEIRFNTTQNAFEGFNGSSWGPLSAQSAHPITLFSATGTYAANELVIYNGAIYRANAAVTPGAWNATQWTSITGLSYTLPIATTTVIGGVKANAGTAGQFVNGVDATGALTYATPPDTVYTLPAATAAALGGVKAPTTNGKVVTGVAADGTLQQQTFTAGRVPYADSTGALADDADLTYDATNNNMSIAGTVVMGSAFALRNMVINGSMVINQRNSGAAITPSQYQYCLDRYQCYLNQPGKYSVQQNAGGVTPPPGFKSYLGVTSLSAYAVPASEQFNIKQYIEGYNSASLAWGTADAKSATLSFWARSSLTGTFGGIIANSGGSRIYPYSYNIPTANTWTRITVTIPGDTTGAWSTDNGVGIQVVFSLGAGASTSQPAGAWTATACSSSIGAQSIVGTNGATFYITGIQLEEGTIATPFERRPIGLELSLCQRYYEKSYDISVAVGSATEAGISRGYFPPNVGGANVAYKVRYVVGKRAVPTIRWWDAAGNANRQSAWSIANFIANNLLTSSMSIQQISSQDFAVNTADLGNYGSYGVQWDADAEL